MKKHRNIAIIMLMFFLFINSSLQKASEVGDRGYSTANITIHPRSESMDEVMQTEETQTQLENKTSSPVTRHAAKKLPQTNERATNKAMKLGLALVAIALLGFTIYKNQRRMK
ncbi:LPXTG cell wall anchor domain-containing protein [Vagococcus lutrae]|uniref:LPXTG cell wall anchor domain-containing protein n=1 Tax=Vagococcus lutrae TaxID=81947 RepID=UPI002896532F|nr:LPXTG cell wall anchor domain-containing protein [Vagococcus lutrae]